jgi:benzoyl-CoA reductase/2-hydroxyglutaryl-CoA dehydratase subunit BcrC/BadD/HgdB
MVMCDLWTGEFFMMNKDLKADGVPFLKLEREYAVVNTGQVRTRAQAFVESIGGRR